MSGRDRSLANARVLVVDDDAAVAAVFERILGGAGCTVSLAHDAASAVAAIAASKPDVVLLDVVLPDLNGFEVCRRLKNDAATRLTPIVLVTGLNDRNSRIKGREAGADDFLTKPVDSDELLARVTSLFRVKRYTDDLDSAASIIMALAVMIEARDGYTEGHCHRMANYAVALGRRLGLGPDEMQALHRGGFLHDIGMLTIPDGVLRKTGALEPEEFELIKSHTVVGEGLCGTLRSLQSVRPIVRHHHERTNGSGYPDGLSGDAIPLLAQIIGIVDVYDAVTTERPYQHAHSPEEAVGVLRRHVEQGWRRRDLVEEFAVMVREGKLESFAQ